MICNTCHVDKAINDFHKNGKTKDGSVAYRPDCKECYTIARKVNKRKVMKFINNTKHRTGELRTITVHDWKDVLLHFRGGCAYCGIKPSRRIKLTKDHVVPVSSGGLTVRGNMVPACTRCNSSKSDREIVGWFSRQPFYSEARLELIWKWVRQE